MLLSIPARGELSADRVHTSLFFYLNFTDQKISFSSSHEKYLSNFFVLQKNIDSFILTHINGVTIEICKYNYISYSIDTFVSVLPEGQNEVRGGKCAYRNIRGN